MSYRLSDQRYEEIKGEVITIMEEYEVKCIPVNGFEIATKMGITLIPYSSLTSEQLEAAMKVSPDGFFAADGLSRERIYYNDSMGYERTNWTILHEIGHAALGHLEHNEEAEAEANFFAKYASAPPALVHRIKPKTPSDIEEAFGLSYEAACNAFDYYHKWLWYGPTNYTSYEIRLLNLFFAA